MIGTYERRRGTAIVETSKGILVVRGRNPKSTFILPGGGTRGKESRLQAAVRELREETGLVAYGVLFLFQYQKSKVFLIKANGIPKAYQEISQVGYYYNGSSLPISTNTKKIIEQYWEMKFVQ